MKVITVVLTEECTKDQKVITLGHTGHQLNRHQSTELKESQESDMANIYASFRKLKVMFRVNMILPRI